MPRIKQISCSTWEEFKASILSELFLDKRFKRGKYIFRGQMSCEWKLTTSFDRWFATLKSGDPDYIEQAIIDSFRKECSKLEQQHHTMIDGIELLALGQHYGLPTRLLDWSESYYIAAFFALTDALLSNYDGDIAIWALDVNDKIWSSQNGVQIIDTPLAHNPRLRNQEGRFTLSKTPFKCLEDYVNYSEKENTCLYQFVLPADEAKIAISDLDVMGITHAKIYPELLGHAKAAIMQTFLSE